MEAQPGTEVLYRSGVMKAIGIWGTKKAWGTKYWVISNSKQPETGGNMVTEVNGMAEGWRCGGARGVDIGSYHPKVGRPLTVAEYGSWSEKEVSSGRRCGGRE